MLTERFCPWGRTEVTRGCVRILNNKHNQAPFRFPGNTEFQTVTNLSGCTSHRSKPEIRLLELGKAENRKGFSTYSDCRIPLVKSEILPVNRFGCIEKSGV